LFMFSLLRLKNNIIVFSPKLCQIYLPFESHPCISHTQFWCQFRSIKSVNYKWVHTVVSWEYVIREPNLMSIKLINVILRCDKRIFQESLIFRLSSFIWNMLMVLYTTLFHEGTFSFVYLNDCESWIRF